MSTSSVGYPPRCADRVYHDLFSAPEVVAVRERVRARAITIAPIAHRIARGDEHIDGFPVTRSVRWGLLRIPSTADVGGDDLAHPVMSR